MDDEPHVVLTTSRWKRGCVFCILICLLITMVSCPLGVFGVWQGTVAPPWFDRTFGPLRLVGYSTWNANCPPYTGCAPTRREAYVIWLIRNPSQSPGSTRRVYRLINLPIVHEG